MFIPESITARSALRESRGILAVSRLYALTIVLLREFTNFHFLSIPTAPVTVTVTSVAVSLYLGFKSNQAYGS
tara:strand:+ start:67 stop:285 length:219 start_codon:yes stop_codon:yes gene_type:complete